ncbi:MAG TPA: hypothetical protein VE046_10800 [Steroidobacteraceae bacterium]|nr:hypothetical protein [Steroidobacteraceae bacterium]
MTTTTPLPAAAEGALAEGRFIEAIKILRQSERLDLTQAKQRLDAYLAANPELKERVQRKSREMRGKILKWVLLLDGIIILLVLYWFFRR